MILSFKTMHTKNEDCTVRFSSVMEEGVLQVCLLRQVNLKAGVLL